MTIKKRLHLAAAVLTVAMAALALAGCAAVNDTLAGINDTLSGLTTPSGVTVNGDQATIAQNIDLDVDGVHIACHEVIANRLVGERNDDYGKKYGLTKTFDAIFEITNNTKRTVKGLDGKFALYDRHEDIARYDMAMSFISGSLGGRMSDFKTGKTYQYTKMAIKPGQTLKTKISVLGDPDEMMAPWNVSGGIRIDSNKAHVFPPNRQYTVELKDVEINFK